MKPSLYDGKVETASMPVLLDLKEIRKSLSNSEMERLQKTKNNKLKLQRAHAYYLIKKLLAQKKVVRGSIHYTKTGRPATSKGGYDISFSHKPDKVFVGISKCPHRIGVDVEQIDKKLNTKIFMSYAFSGMEKTYLKKFCNVNTLSFVQGVIIFWSVKESFLKCLDYKFLPKTISIAGLSKKSGSKKYGVEMKINNKIKKTLKEKRLKIESITVKLDKDFIYSVTIMKKKIEKN